MQNQQAMRQEIAALEAEALRAAQAGQEDTAARGWAKVLERDPAHGRALMSLGKIALRRGELASARRIFERCSVIDGANLQAWLNLALVCQAQRDEAGEEAAIHRALVLDAGDLIALILRAGLLERQGKRHQAAAAHGAVATVAPPLDQLSPELRPAVSHAMAFRQQYQDEYGKFMDDFLDQHYRQLGGEKLGRFRDSVDIMLGRKARYDSQSMLYHFPGLAPISFFERADFPWLDEIEAGTDTIRAEFLQVLAAEEGFTPYLSYPDDVPHNQFAELNNSPRWSAFHLIEFGKVNQANAARCPATMALLGGAPQPDQPGRTPSAMFSLLKPKTRIPAHVGASNVRLVTHLPLIVPEHCGFRVGNEMREWVPGKAWVFDDTINHEAWNNSDKLRVIIMFDIWHPHLTPPERAMITALTEGINRYTGRSDGYAL